MKIAMIAAFERNRGIGNEGKIIWDFPGDREYFKTTTTGHITVFGRKSYEEIARPLPGRISIIVSKSKIFEGKNLYTAKSLEKAIELGKKIAAAPKEGQDFLSDRPLIFLCGGEEIYRAGMKMADLIFTTQIDADYRCDRFFPKIDDSLFTEVSRFEKIDKGVKLTFISYRRK